MSRPPHDRASAARPFALAVLAAGTMAGTVACRGADRVAGPPARSFTASPALLAAVDDAGARVLPALAPAVRPALSAALAELQGALAAGEARRTRQALESLRAAVAAQAPSEAAVCAIAPAAERADTTATADASGVAAAADLAVLDMLVTAAERELAAPTSGGEGAP